MNLPNKLTVLRICLIPFFMIFAFPLPEFMHDLWVLADYRILIALGIFIIASVTDVLDGNIARKYNLVTDFGKFLDPIADKLLVTVALLSLTQVSQFYMWATMIILTREFAVTGMRLVAASKGTVIAAGISGKLKTLTQCFAICGLLGGWGFKNAFPAPAVFSDVLFIAGNVLLVIAVILTIYSGIEYFIKNAGCLKEK